MDIQGIVDSLPVRESKKIRNVDSLIKSVLKKGSIDGMAMTKSFEEVYLILGNSVYSSIRHWN